MPECYHVKAQGVRPGQQHVFMAMPVGAPVDAAMLDFVLHASRHLEANGIASDWFFLAHHCHVDDARNQIVWEFLNTECSDFFFVDADTASQHDAATRLLKLPHAVLAGIYPYKGDTLAFPVRLRSDGRVEYDEHGCVEVEAVPTGFLRIKRHVLETMEAVSDGYWNKEVTKETSNRPIPLLFERTIEYTGETLRGRKIGDRWGGDYSWCRKWAAMGGKFSVDPTLWMRHHGFKAYAGNVGRYWAHNRGEQTPAFDEAIAALQLGAPRPGHFGRLEADWGNEYSAKPDMQSAIYWGAREATGPILETGSGLSTVVLGIAARLSGTAVYALEHDPDHYRKTVDALKRYDLGNVRVHYAPLRVHRYAGGRSCLWYEIPADLPAEFDMVVCDGPQQRFGRDGLYKLLGDRLTHAKILMDDAGTDERAIDGLRVWAARHGRTDVHVITTGERPFAISLPSTLSAAA